MPQTINTNIASLTAQRNLDSSQSANQLALQRLSSGLRINSAKDDAAGLAISTRFDAQVRGLNVAIRNAGDGISLAQTAEGALGAVTDNLQRLRELSLQASNATNSDSDRAALNAEAQQIIEEIGRVSEQTNFNGTNLLNGGFNASVQIGTNRGEKVDFAIRAVTADRLGGGSGSGVSATGTSSGIASGDLVINGVAIEASKGSDDTASVANQAASAIAKAATINRATDQTGVTAKVNVNTVAGTTQVAAAGTGTVVLNNVSIDVAVGGVDADADRQSVVTAINSKSDQTGVVAVDTGSTAGGVILEAADGRNVTIDFTGDLTGAKTGLAAEASDGTAETYEGSYTLISDDIITIIDGGDGTGSGNLANSGLQRGSYESNLASVASTSRTGAGVAASVVTGAVAGFDFSGSNATFDITISGATTGAQDASDTISLTTNLADADAAQAAIQAEIDAGALAGLVTVTSDGTNLTFARTTGEGGTLTIDTFAGAGAASVDTFLGLADGSTSVSSDDAGTTGATVTAGADTNTTSLSAGDLVINGVSIVAAVASDDTASDTTANSSDAAASAIATAAAINKASGDTGVTAVVNANIVTGGTATTAADAGASGTIFVNGVETGTVTAAGDLATDRASAIDAINAISGQTGVLASDNGSSITLTAADGRNISIAVDNDDDAAVFAAGLGLDPSVAGIAEANIDGATFTYASVAETTYGTVTLQSAGAIKVSSSTNGATGVSDIGFSQGTFGGASDGQFLTEVDISTEEGALTALKAIDNALDSVNAERANLGAIQNRLDQTISTLAVNVENLSTANSRIVDADFAKETAELSRTQVLQQAGVAILAQANAAPQLVLSLLQ